MSRAVHDIRREPPHFNPQQEIVMMTEAKCPFHSGQAAHATSVPGRTNRDWWPNQLNMKLLRQHSALGEVLLQ